MDDKHIELRKRFWKARNEHLKNLNSLINVALARNPKLQDGINMEEKRKSDEETLQLEEQMDDVVIEYMQFNKGRALALQIIANAASDPIVKVLASQLQELYEQNASFLASINDMGKKMTYQDSLNMLGYISNSAFFDKLGNIPDELKKIIEENTSFKDEIRGKVQATLQPLKEQLDKWKDLDMKHKKEGLGIA